MPRKCVHKKETMQGGITMSGRGFIAAFALAATCCATAAAAQPADPSKYPNWKGQWQLILARNVGGQNIRFDPTKAWGRSQQAPLTSEYQKVHEDSMADQAKGGLGNYPTAKCLPSGMPRMTELPLHEYVITPDTTYVLLGSAPEVRRIFTDGRSWPAESDPSYEGYAIGKWIDEDGDGRYDVLEVETRGPFKGPRAYDATGLPLAFDNQSVFKERFHLDKNDPNILHDEITVYDHALTRPWSVDKTLRRNPNPRPDWTQSTCAEGNNQIVIGEENYFLSGEGLLMPAKKNQSPPDLRYFKQTQK
jgi:hypothetical protein